MFDMTFSVSISLIPGPFLTSSQSLPLCSLVLTLNSWIVFVHEMALDKLKSNGALSDASAANYHHLVFSL